MNVDNPEPAPLSARASSQVVDNRRNEVNRDRQRRYCTRLSAATDVSLRHSTPPENLQIWNREWQRCSRANRVEWYCISMTTLAYIVAKCSVAVPRPRVEECRARLDRGV